MPSRSHGVATYARDTVRMLIGRGNLGVSAWPRGASLSRRFVVGVCLGASIGVLACAAPDERATLVASLLIDDNEAWLVREPALVADKLTKMQRGTFSWMRGTLPVYQYDALHGMGLDTTWQSDDASDVAALGDPHPENLGTFSADGQVALAWNDFDAATYAPYWLDVLRLAFAMEVASNEQSHGALAAETAAGYAAYLVQANLPPMPPALEKLVTKARNADDVALLNEMAPIDQHGQRRFRFGDLEEPASDGVLEETLRPIDNAEWQWIHASVATWSTSTRLVLGEAALELIDVARRYGAGVASYPAWRYYLLLDVPNQATDDNILVEWKEVRPVRDVAPARDELSSWDDAAERAIWFERAALDEAVSDRYAGFVSRGRASLRSRRLTKTQKNFDADTIEESTVAALQEANDIAYWFGASLARFHCRVPTRRGRDARTAIRAVVEDRQDEFIAHVAERATAYVRQTIADRQAFEILDLRAMVLKGTANHAAK